MLRVCFVISSLGAGAAPLAAPTMRFVEHNPHGVAVHTVHLVQSTHLDIGCKTFGCSASLAPGEPDRCLAGHVEPYAYHIINRHLDEFLLRGAALANASRGSATPDFMLCYDRAGKTSQPNALASAIAANLPWFEHSKMEAPAARVASALIYSPMKATNFDI